MQTKAIRIITSEEVLALWKPTALAQDGQLVVSFCMEGSMEIEINARPYPFAVGMLLTLMPQSFVVFKKESPDFRCMYLLFSFRTIDEMILPTNYNFLNVLVEQPLLALKKEDQLIFEQYRVLFQQQISMTSIFQPDAVRYLLYSLIAHINRVYEQEEQTMEPSTRKDVTVFKFYNLLHQSYLVEKSVGFYASQLKLTPKYLTTLIRQRTGKSISKVIIELVIIKAKTYLTATEIPIYQIAEQLHFTDATTFCRYFKTYVGQSPRQYRQINHAYNYDEREK